MAFRTFATMKLQSSSVAQPLVGSWITAGLTGPVAQPTVVTLGTACNAGNDATQLFYLTDEAWLINVDGSGTESVRISALFGNTLTIGLKNNGLGAQGQGTGTINTHASGAFGTGTFIIPKTYVNNLLVAREDGQTGTWMYLGNAWNMTASYRRIFKLANVGSGSQPISYSASESYGGNPYDTSELWVFGTANDLYTPVFNWM